MSRVEHDSYKESDCLCGQGQVTRHVSSTDYPFGSAEVSYALDCQNCARDWRLDHRTFVLRSSERAYAAIRNELDIAHRILQKMETRIIDDHFAFISPRTKKAELEELTRLGFVVGNY
jgi:hypothetical protein